ncbi:DUF3168 domain-containing protein [uncultured Bosea sp.]|uniref:DUF3168 domain-containing protein n=1 Tax=uncultured Bosea sp. TaxID=211457 RepID=UPI00263B4F9C|nr:DUF3168 domain-containing protein [uncultured Bosea sp.]
MSDAILALRVAVQARLLADTPLTTLIGPDRIFDEAPRAARGLYVVHGEVEARDWSTGSDRGCEQEFTLVVWAAQSGSSRQALEAAGLIVAALDQVDLTVNGHALVNLRWLSSRLAREMRNGLPQVTIRFRAVTETL